MEQKTIHISSTVPKTPLEKLRFRKNEIELQTKIHETKIAQSFEYVQHHAPHLIMDGVKSMIFGDNKSSDDKGGHGFDKSNLLSLAKGMIIPVALSVAQPMILSWGLGKIPTWIINFVIKKLKKR